MHQNNVADGQLLRYYWENMENLRHLGPNLPKYTYDMFTSWGFCLILRTSPVVHSLNYLGKLLKIYIYKSETLT